jgi:hypothetical protein
VCLPQDTPQPTLPPILPSLPPLPQTQPTTPTTTPATTKPPHHHHYYEYWSFPGVYSYDYHIVDPFYDPFYDPFIYEPALGWFRSAKGGLAGELASTKSKKAKTSTKKKRKTYGKRIKPVRGANGKKQASYPKRKVMPRRKSKKSPVKAAKGIRPRVKGIFKNKNKHIKTTS